MSREFFAAHALEVAPKLLGSHLAVHSDAGAVRVRITEVEAYHGVGVPGPYDAGSHSRDRKTKRNASMFGPPGHAYVYFTYGMHYAINLVCSPSGTASGVLIRSGEVVQGLELATARRADKRAMTRTVSGAPPATKIREHELARGPGNLATALGVTTETHDGLDLLRAPFEFEWVPEPSVPIMRGPRVGVSGVAGGTEFPWRFWLSHEPSVSAYRPGRNVPTHAQQSAR